MTSAHARSEHRGGLEREHPAAGPADECDLVGRNVFDDGREVGRDGGSRGIGDGI
jgi:hypothetical protein